MIFVDGYGERVFKMIDELEFLAGVTTNPTILKDAGVGLKDALDRLSEIRGLHFVQVSIGNTAWKDVLARYPVDKFVIKVAWDPLKVERVISDLRKMGYRICATAVYNEAQAVIVSEMGVDYIAIYYDRMERNGMNPRDLISFSKSLGERVIVASLKSPYQMLGALRAGADDLTAPPDVLEAFLSPVFPENDLEIFERDFRL